MTDAGKALVKAGVELYAIILIGLVGRNRSEENARATAKIINEIEPAHLAAMTYMPVPGTPMYADIEAGRFEVLSDEECLQETKWLVENLDHRHMHFNSSHASNYVPIDGDIYTDRDRILNDLEKGISVKESRGQPKTGALKQAIRK